MSDQVRNQNVGFLIMRLNFIFTLQVYQPIKDKFVFNDVVRYTESLPDYDSPELFGMTENAEKACLEIQAHELIDTIVSVQPRLSMGLLG